MTTLTLEPDGSRPVALAVDSSNNRIYVADAASDNVSVIDSASQSLIATIPVGRDPHAIAVNPLTNTVYVANRGSNDVTVIDGESHQVITTVRVGKEPWDLALYPNSGRVFVSNRRSGTVSVIDGRLNIVTATASVGKRPTGVVVDPQTGHVYVAGSAGGDLRVIDGVSNLLFATLPLADGSTAKTWDVAVDGGSSRLYVATSDGEASDASVGAVAVVDTSTNSLINSISAPGPVEVLAVDPARGRIYAGSSSDDRMWAIDARDSAVTSVVALEGGLSALDVDPASGHVYAAHGDSNALSVVSWMPGITLAPGWTYACYLGNERSLEEALASADDSVSAVYRLASGSGYDRWFPDRPDLSTIATVHSHEALFILADDYTPWMQEPSEAIGHLTLAPGWNSVCFWGDIEESTGAAGEVGDSFAVAYSLTTDGTWRRFVPGRPDLGDTSQLEDRSPLIVLVPSPGAPEAVESLGPLAAPEGVKNFVLTFDDSGSDARVSQILDTLAQYGARAIFFPTGSWAADNPLIDRMWEEGHLVCNHTYSHAYLPSLSAEGIRNEILSGAGVGKCSLLRPPYGAHNSLVDSVADSLGYSIYKWDVDPWDWSGVSASHIATNVLYNAHPGAVVVLHMHARNTLAALPSIIEGLLAADYVLSY